MRELRELGWDYDTIKRKEDGRMRSHHRLTAFTDWPDGDIEAEIKRREKAKQRTKKTHDSTRRSSPREVKKASAMLADCA